MNPESLKVLMISSDRNIALKGSAVSSRMKEYASLVDELHIILLSDSSHGLKETEIDKNIWVYPTNSLFKFLRPLDAIRIGKKLVINKNFVRGLSVITAQDPFECGWSAIKIKEKWRIPVEIQLHTNPFSPFFSGYLNKIRKFIAKKTIQHADRIRVVSDELKEELSKFTRAPISVLPIYIDVNRIKTSQVNYDSHSTYGWAHVLLSVSRLSPEKNIETIVESLKIIKKHYPDTGLLIVGDGPEKEFLIRKVNKLGLQGYVEFVGWQEDLASFYKTADVFVQTSLFEGYGMAILEAGLSGLPIVTTPVGVAKSLADEDAVITIPFGRADILASSVINIFEHSYIKERLGLNFRKTIQSILCTKEEYLNKLKENWIITSKTIF